MIQKFNMENKIIFFVKVYKILLNIFIKKDNIKDNFNINIYIYLC